MTTIITFFIKGAAFIETRLHKTYVSGFLHPLQALQLLCAPCMPVTLVLWGAFFFTYPKLEDPASA